MKNIHRSILALCALAIPALFACTTQSSYPRPTEARYAGTVLVHNAWPLGLRISAYHAGAPGQPVWIGEEIFTGQTRRFFGLPPARTLHLKALEDAPAATSYSLVKDGRSSAFTLSPQRAYDLGFAPGSLDPDRMAWSWQLAADPAVEVASLSFSALAESLDLSWKDPAMGDLLAVRIYDRGSKRLLASIPRGVQSATLKGLEGGKALDLGMTCVYPEIESRGIAFRAFPIAARL